jgi:1,4-alpha-glucan branching enzyme
VRLDVREEVDEEVRAPFTRIAVAATAFALLSLAVLLSSCAGILGAIEDRLPPPHEVKGGMLFSYYAPSARQVTLAGSFNNWGGTQGGGRYDPSIDPMEDTDGDGVWTIVMPLPAGRYQYKFVIDGGVRWEQDPNNADTAVESGIQNSLIIVPATVRYAAERVTGTVIGGESAAAEAAAATAEPVAAEPPAGAVEVVFEIKAPDAEVVQVAGSFNNWDKIPLEKAADGAFRTTLKIAPGKYEYMFVIDDTWIEDPANPDTVPNPYGGVNSVLTVK